MADLEFPYDFEKQRKAPSPANGQGPPVQVSAAGLMDNFKFSAVTVDEAATTGLRLKIEKKGKGREISIIKPEATGSIIFNDCEGAEVARLEWKNGMITTTGVQTVEGGCGSSSSSPP